VIGALLGVIAAGCGSDDDTAGMPPAGPTADLSEEISGGNGPFTAAGSEARLAEYGYVEQEFVASGTAVSYVALDPQTADGRWNFAVDESIPSAPYRTR